MSEANLVRIRGKLSEIKIGHKLPWRLPRCEYTLHPREIYFLLFFFFFLIHIRKCNKNCFENDRRGNVASNIDAK